MSDDENAFVMESCDIQALRDLMHRLYGEPALSGDERRDLANRMHAILEHAIAIPRSNLENSNVG